MQSKYCPDVWKSLYVEKASPTEVNVGFCCQSTTTSLTDHNNLDKVQFQARANYEARCNNCWKIENVGGQSRRHSSIEWFANNQLTQDQVPELRSLDWNSENICNLACITCGPKFSSRWSQEISHYKFTDTARHVNCQDNDFWQTLDFKNINRIYFNGGEPMLVDDHYKILTQIDTIDRLSQVEVAYNTNGTVFPTEQILNLWSRARLVRISLSIDAVSSAFEFIRWPAKWQQMLEFIDFLKSQQFNIIIDITCTVGLHNVLELESLLSWQTQNLLTNHQGDPVTMCFQPVGGFSTGGQRLSLTNAGPKLAQRIIEQTQSLQHHSAWNWISQQLQSGAENIEWIDYLDQLSNKRRLDWTQALPRLAELVSRSTTAGK
jgi:molybdenum cofactor biosynthesis enzyme MoaA